MPTGGIYLRPAGLSSAKSLKRLIDQGRALPLAGGPLAFNRVEIIRRRPDGRQLERRDLPLDGLSSDDPLGVFLKRLSRPRHLPKAPLIMGVVNVTPDSFSDGGDNLDPDRAAARVEALRAAGADIIDIGGESVRPGADPVDPAVERQRILPLFDRLAERRDLLTSIDSRRATVMTAALARGANMINDVSALSDDPESLRVAADSDAWVVLMHRQGTPATMNQAPRYQDAALDIFDYLAARVQAAVDAGIARDRLIVDPGIGFGKKGAHNLSVLNQLALFHGLGCPLLIGVSRKGLTGAIERTTAPKDRLSGSLAAALSALDQGVQILRVHDVAETRQAVRVWQAILDAEPA